MKTVIAAVGAVLFAILSTHMTVRMMQIGQFHHVHLSTTTCSTSRRSGCRFGTGQQCGPFRFKLRKPRFLTFECFPNSVLDFVQTCRNRISSGGFGGCGWFASASATKRTAATVCAEVGSRW